MSDAPNSISTDISELELRVAVAIASRRDAFAPGEKLAQSYLDDARVVVEVMRSVAQRQPVPPEQESLTERLRNPLWAHSNAPFESPQLEKEENLAAMAQAADEIDRLRGITQAQRSPEQRLRAGEMVSWDRDGPIASAPEYPDAPIVCAELYQVIGYIAYHYGIMEHPDVQKALDNASQHKLVHTDLLPFPKQDLPRPLDPAYASSVTSTQRKTD